MKLLRRLKAICIIVLIAFSWNFLGIANLALAITSATASTTDSSTNTDNPLIDLSVQTQAFANALRTIQAGLQQGQDQTAALTAASSQLNDILSLQDSVSAKLQEIQTSLPPSPPPEALDRLTDFINQTQKGFSTLAALADSLNQLMAQDQISASDLAPLMAAVDSLVPSSAANITNSAQKLPHRRSDIEKRAPAAQPAITIGTTSPTADDLAATKDIQFSPEITNLASQLQNDPVQMYLYVLNNVDYQPYYGSVKGSQGVYWEKAGNDIDQASFLMALFRISGYPARYITGTVQITIDQAMNWTGGKTPQAAVNILQNNGIPLQTVTAADGSITAINLTHTWVELHVLDKLHNHKWVQLDPSFKQFQYLDGIDLTPAMGFDFNSFYNAAIAGATINPDQFYVTNLNSTNIDNNLDAYVDNLQTWINTNLPNATVGDVLGYRQIVQQQVDKHFRGAFPFQNFTPQSELSVLPDSQRYQINFQMTGLNYSTSLPELYGKRLTLDYVPASDYDQQLIDEAGGIYNVFALMVSMKPQLKLEGQVVAEGQGVTLGSYQICTTSFLQPSGTAWDSNDKYVTTGADYCISLDYQRISSELLNQRANDFQNLPAGSQEVEEEALNLTGMVYFTEVELFSNMEAKINHISWTREPAEAFLASDLTVSSFFGIPIGVKPGPLDIDVKRYPVEPVSNTGNSPDEINWMIASGSFSSAAENLVFEQLYQIVAVSTEKLLALANDQGIRIYTINQDNISQTLPAISAPSSYKQSMTDSVNAGYTVVVPQTGLQVNYWYGYCWEVIDPKTGACAFLIGGSLTSGSSITAAGGMTAKIDPFTGMQAYRAVFTGNLNDVINEIGEDIDIEVAKTLFLDLGIGATVAGTVVVAAMPYITWGMTVVSIARFTDWLSKHMEWVPVDP
jgi:Transglutaminase-like superfamily